MLQIPSADLTQAFANIGRLEDLLELGRTGFCERLISGQQLAEERFRVKGYAVWPEMSRHPHAMSLLAFRQLLAGTVAIEDPVIQARILPLAEDAFAVDAFRHDWHEHADKLAARLRAPEECSKALFELRTCLYLRNLGHDVEYLAVKNTGRTGPDLIVHGEPEIEFECVLVDQDGGRRVPLRKAMEVGVQLLQEMEKLGVNRVVFVSTDEKLAASDVHPLLAAIKPSLLDNPPKLLTGLNSKYSVTVLNGGSRDEPLSTEEAEQLLRALHESPVRWGIMNPPSKTIIVPDRYVVRGVSIRSTRGDGAINHVVRAALDKAGQYVSSRPLVISAGFGMPLMEHQARTELLGLALQKSIGSSLERRLSVSGIAFVFGTGWHAQPVIGGRGVSFDARTTVQAFRNPDATYPLPGDFTWGEAVMPIPNSPRP